MPYPISVVPRYLDEPLEHMLKRLKRKLKHDGRILEMRRKEYFIRPGELRRQKRRRKKFSDGRNIE